VGHTTGQTFILWICLLPVKIADKLAFLKHEAAKRFAYFPLSQFGSQTFNLGAIDLLEVFHAQDDPLFSRA
jgi:hypothetical protein